MIITDLRMPQGEGEYVLECLKRIADTAHIPVIVLTGERGEDLPGRLSSLGAAGFLRKPFQFDDLVGELSRHIELRARDFAVEQAYRKCKGFSAEGGIRSPVIVSGPGVAKPGIRCAINWYPFSDAPSNHRFLGMSRGI